MKLGKKSKFVALLLCIVMTVALVACSSGGGDSGSGDDDTIKVGLILTGVNGIFAEFITALEAGAEEYGVEFQFTEGLDDSKKIAAIENYVAAGVDVIICQVGNPEATKPAMEAAQAAGVKFISYDMDTEGSDAFFGVNNSEFGYAIGKNAAEWVNATFDSSQEVKVGLTNYPPLQFLVERAEGIEQALNEIAPNAKIVVTAQGGLKDEGVTAGEAWVQSQPDLNVIVGINDDGVLGVYEAFKGAGKADSDTIGFFGGDATQEACKLISEGTTYRMSVSTDLVGIAPQFISVAAALGKGETVNHDNAFPLYPVDRDNVADFITG
ncbi:MAG: sugar ABC transporter substrate-binding protein [Clostridiales Family XIII bacterium]|nr:sugar ABC transporter substrate-binding protein [Clostridiales Family XIII bacterium]